MNGPTTLLDGPTEGHARLAAALGEPDSSILVDRVRRADRLLASEGAGHLLHDDAGGIGGWRFDPLPGGLTSEEFAEVAEIARQRIRLMEAVLADCYGDRRLVREGHLSPDLLHGLDGFRPSDAGRNPVGHWLTTFAVDLVRSATGEWLVLDDVPTATAGLGHALLNRWVLGRLIPEAIGRAKVVGTHAFLGDLRRALVASAVGHPGPRVVVLSAGPSDTNYVEHSYLARRLGYHLVESGDVVMREGRLWLRGLDSLEPIDVVCRRVGDARLDPMEHRHVGGGEGVPGLVWGARRGGPVLANAYGADLVGELDLTEHAGAMSEVLLGEPLRAGRWTPGQSLAGWPVFDGTQTLALPVVMRVQVARIGQEIAVMPGCAARVVDDPANPRNRGRRLAKDVWVLGNRPVPIAAVVVPPQVDLAGSIVRRVAEAMFGLGRAAEQAEVSARTMLVIGTHLQNDPSLAADDGWVVAARAMFGVATGRWDTDPGSSVADDQRAALRATGGFVTAILAEARSVREYLSTTTGRLLMRLTDFESRAADGQASVDAVDSLLVDLAAFAGLATESTVRGPAWRFLDLGRRIQRALLVAGDVNVAMLGPGGSLQSRAEAMLAIHESLVAYRRRFRSDVDRNAVVNLLIHDADNPRSLEFQLARIGEHAVVLGWPNGPGLVAEARRAASDSNWTRVGSTLSDLATSVAVRWFSDPVRPTIVQGH